MVPISVTGVHNCPPNCFITGQGGPRSVCAFPPHLDAGKPSPEFQTCICLLPWFPKSASFICTPEILTQTPLMEIPMAGCAVGRAGRGGSAHDGLRMGGTRVLLEGARKEKEANVRFASSSSSIGCVSTRTVRGPWDFPQETRRPNESSLGPRSGWGKGGDTNCDSVLPRFRQKSVPRPQRRFLRPLVMSRDLSKLRDWQNKREASLELLLGAFCKSDYSVPRLAAPVRKRLID